MIDASIGANVKKVREIRSLTTEMLGDLLGVTSNQIEKYENGSHRISAVFLFDIARILDFPIGDFFNDINHKK